MEAMEAMEGGNLILEQNSRKARRKCRYCEFEAVHMLTTGATRLAELIPSSEDKHHSLALDIAIKGERRNMRASNWSCCKGTA
jgi:hypothetical protein